MGRLRGCLLLLLTFIAPLRAHELGALHATITFGKDGRFAVEVVVDLEHVPVDQRPPKDASPDQFRQWQAAFLQRLSASFDGRPVSLDEARFAGYKDGISTEPRFQVEGRIPAGAKEFGWIFHGPLPSYLLTLQRAGEDGSFSQWIAGNQAGAPFDLGAAMVPVTFWGTVWLYLCLGFTHIVPKGLDHICFVLGLFLLSLRIRPLLAQTTAFTVAHSITLGLTMLGLVSLPPRIVEPMIALSIAYVAIENLATSELKTSRVVLVFAFGLVHGMGFAGVLKDLGLPRSQFVPALVSFNVGVEAGQLAVILAAFLAVGWWAGRKPWYRRRVVIPASLAIAATGLFWTVQRVFF